MQSSDLLLSALGRHAGLPEPLAFDEQGCACLVFDGAVTVTLETSQDTGPLHMYSVLGVLPDGNRETLLMQLLNANLFGAETAGATLAVDGQSDEIILCRQVDAEETSDGVFVSMLEQFVAAAEDLTATLSKMDANDLV